MENNLTSTLNGLNSTLQVLFSQIGSLNNSNNQPSSSSGIPSQALPNPKGGINAITLRSGTTLQKRNHEEPSQLEHAPAEDKLEVEDDEKEGNVQDTVEVEVTQPENSALEEAKATKDVTPVSFPHLARKPRKQMELNPKMVEIFKKVEVNVLLFDVIQQVPKYAKFLKDLCIHKDRINELETIPLGNSISALMGDILEKYSDLGPYMVNLVGIAEDVLVSIKGLTFPIDFYILEMPPNDSGKPSSILLGRPFLKTSKFKLDPFPGTYSFEIDGRAVSFNLNKAMKHPPEDHSIFQCDIIDETVTTVHQEEVEEKYMEQGPSVGTPSEHNEDTLPLSLVPDNPEPSHEQKFELKPLPPHLKYIYLEDNQKLPVIIARDLTSQ
ncbi:uncharacterized protein LOC130975148 [Arachis stenosperma]|uniref:uncharacterized protein LOC130975148 n=1 Tax=Arachis stenosperma TaxID=217475 RepID=UPI0025ACC0DC|nr:uncharacterized protein LOC130975148 [Arachis stenosperma]